MRWVAVRNSGRAWRAFTEREGENAPMKAEVSCVIFSERKMFVGGEGEGECSLFRDMVVWYEVGDCTSRGVMHEDVDDGGVVGKVQPGDGLCIIVRKGHPRVGRMKLWNDTYFCFPHRKHIWQRYLLCSRVYNY